MTGELLPADAHNRDLPPKGTSPQTSLSGCAANGGVREGVGYYPKTPDLNPFGGYQMNDNANPQQHRHGHEAEARQQQPEALSQQSIRRYGAAAIYRDNQEGGAMCAMHAIDSLLQRPAASRAQLHRIAEELDNDE